MTLTGKLDTATLRAMVSESLAKRFPGLRVENITLPYMSSYDSSFELSDEPAPAPMLEGLGGRPMAELDTALGATYKALAPSTPLPDTQV